MKKTKIVCTMGPNTDDYNMMKKLVSANMDVARFNFSHGDYEEHGNRYELLKRARKETGRQVAALLDTKGPEIRTGLLKDHKKVMIQTGQKFTFTTEECEGTAEKVYINYTGLNNDVKPGDRILVDDGLLGFKVIDVVGPEIHCEAQNSGELSEKRGVNVPYVSIKLPGVTDKDIEDIKFGIKMGFDFVAASFIRNADCVRQIRAIIDEAGSPMKIISKIENHEGIENMDEIIEASDGVMVARGDMGVEIEPEKIPHIQKEIIRKCNYAGKIVITATQMLDSMIRNPRPTRAEVTDVANAVYDGTDAVMLSGETAMGKYPYEALSMMAQVVNNTEQYLDYERLYKGREVDERLVANVSNAVCNAAVSTANELHAAAIVTPTISGFTARMISKYRPKSHIYALSPDETTVRQMMLLWGVKPVWAKRAESTDELVETSIAALKEQGCVKAGDLAVVTAGVVDRKEAKKPATQTNIMRVVEVE